MATTIKDRRHFSNFALAGFSYWDGVIVFKKLKIGTKLRFEREADNKFDAYAVAIYYKEHKIGFVPRTCNKEISKFCEMGHADLFDVRINRVSPDEHTENQIGVVVFLKPNIEQNLTLVFETE